MFFNLFILIFLLVPRLIVAQEDLSNPNLSQDQKEIFVQKVDFLYGNWNILSIKQEDTEKEIFQQGWDKFSISLNDTGSFKFEFVSKKLSKTDFEINQESLGYQIKLLNQILELHANGQWNFDMENKKITLVRNFTIKEEPVTEILSTTMFQTFNLVFLTPRELVFTITKYDSNAEKLMLLASEVNEKGETTNYLIDMKKDVS